MPNTFFDLSQYCPLDINIPKTWKWTHQGPQTTQMPRYTWVAQKIGRSTEELSTVRLSILQITTTNTIQETARLRLPVTIAFFLNLSRDWIVVTKISFGVLFHTLNDEPQNLRWTMNREPYIHRFVGSRLGVVLWSLTNFLKLSPTLPFFSWRSRGKFVVYSATKAFILMSLWWRFFKLPYCPRYPRTMINGPASLESHILRPAGPDFKNRSIWSSCGCIIRPISTISSHGNNSWIMMRLVVESTPKPSSSRMLSKREFIDLLKRRFKATFT